MYSLSRTMEIKPLSKKYVQYYQNCKNCQMSIAEGAYRAGKTLVHVLSFAAYLENCEDTVHLVSGASEATARLNVADCNGFGLSYLFRGRCSSGRYHDNSCLKISTRTGEKIVIFVGGAVSNSYKRIQGLSFGSWLSVEVANLYISDDEKCFIDMALSRLTQSKNKRVWWDLNPVYESHKIYTKYIDVFIARNNQGTLAGGLNYMQCSLFDNDSLTDEQKQGYASLYPDHESMEYKRYILGLRAAASGVIFKDFALRPSSLIFEEISYLDSIQSKQYVSIGVDFGGNKSASAFVATLIYGNYSGVAIIASDKMDMRGGETDAEEFRVAFASFIERVQKLNVAPIKYAFGDSADKIMISEMRNVKRQLGLGMRVLDSVKGTIADRIKTKKLMMAKKCWHVYKDAKTVIESTKTQVWSPKADDERLDDGSCDIDTADAEEYSWSAFIPYFIKNLSK